jgi:hypothetical protein
MTIVTSRTTGLLLKKESRENLWIEPDLANAMTYSFRAPCRRY